MTIIRYIRYIRYILDVALLTIFMATIVAVFSVVG